MMKKSASYKGRSMPNQGHLRTHFERIYQGKLSLERRKKIFIHFSRRRRCSSWESLVCFGYNDPLNPWADIQECIYYKAAAVYVETYSVHGTSSSTVWMMERKRDPGELNRNRLWREIGLCGIVHSSATNESKGRMQQWPGKKLTKKEETVKTAAALLLPISLCIYVGGGIMYV